MWKLTKPSITHVFEDLLDGNQKMKNDSAIVHGGIHDKKVNQKTSFGET